MEGWERLRFNPLLLFVSEDDFLTSDLVVYTCVINLSLVSVSQTYVNMAIRFGKGEKFSSRRDCS